MAPIMMCAPKAKPNILANNAHSESFKANIRIPEIEHSGVTLAHRRCYVASPAIRKPSASAQRLRACHHG